MMNLRKIIIAGYCVIFLPVFLIAQTDTSGILRVGDTVPDLTLDITNYDRPQLRLADLKGKLVILDFWGVYCSVCIASFPKMEELQRKFGDRIQIILVTDDSPEAVARLAEKSSIVRETKLPSIVGDTVLTRLFEYRTVPAHAWIDENGMVQYFTNGYNTTERTIRAYLDGRPLALADKGERRDFDLSKSLLEEGGGRQLKHLKYYTAIMGRIQDYNAGTTGVLIDSATKKPIRIRVFNGDRLYLYAIAFGESVSHDENAFVNKNRIILDVDDPTELQFPLEIDEEYDAWVERNGVSYESRVPPELSDSLYVFMQRELQNVFGYKGSVEKVIRECLVLRQIGSMELLRSKGGRSKFNLGKQDSLFIQNCPSVFLQRGLHNLYDKDSRPLIIDVQLPERVDVSVSGKLSDIAFVRKELNRYGLDLVAERREIDMLVITD